MHLLDTDTVTLLFESHPRVLHRLRELPDEEVATSAVTRAEILRGRIDFLLKAANGSQLRKAHNLLVQTEAFLARMIVVPLDDNACGHFDRIRAVKALRKVGRADLLIASVALAQEAVLVTRNVRHCKLVANLKIANWAD